MTTINIGKLQNDVHLVDYAFGNMRLDLEILEAVSEEFAQLRQDMDYTDMSQVRFKFMEWHRKTKILSQLISHTIEDLSTEHKAAHRINEEMHKMINQMETEKNLHSGCNQNEGTK